MFFRKSSKNVSANKNRNNTRKSATLNGIEALEQRIVYSVSTVKLNKGVLEVFADNNPTQVRFEQTSSVVRVRDISTNEKWEFSKSKVKELEFHGGKAADIVSNYADNYALNAWGKGGNDELRGNSQNDYLDGGAGNDKLSGGSGNDKIYGGNGSDTLAGGSGNDKLYGEKNGDTLDGGTGNDKLWGDTGDDTLLGDEGNDVIYGGDGRDYLNGGTGNDDLYGEGNRDIIIAIDNALKDYVDGGASDDIIWVDGGKSQDEVADSASKNTIEKVAAFSNKADKTLNGDNINDPNSTLYNKDLKKHVKYAYRNFSNVPVFNDAGPTSDDINQGGVGDCYFLAGLAAAAQEDPETIQQRVVDFNDGTYGVKLGNNFYRVDSDLPYKIHPYTGEKIPAFAQISDLDGSAGSGKSLWVALVEKAFTHHRNGQNSYSSISGGSEHEALQALGLVNVSTHALVNAGASSKSSSIQSWINDLYKKFKNYGAMVIGFHGDSKKQMAAGLPIVLHHAYSVVGFTKANGEITGIQLRNSWGHDTPWDYKGKSDSNINDSIVTLTAKELFNIGCKIRQHSGTWPLLAIAQNHNNQYHPRLDSNTYECLDRADLLQAYI